jgi:predicted hydrolase (HD superfamily)
MNSNSRLLFAAARGARIQFSNDEEWMEKAVWGFHHDVDYRIHPDDEHMQYGPISTALRNAAESGEYPYTVTGLAAETMAHYERDLSGVCAEGYNTFLLILAEVLADEGM